jgi:PIN domain nuclease of toxin-antitoxin system
VHLSFQIITKKPLRYSALPPRPSAFKLSIYGIGLTIVDSTHLNGFHSDPFDQLTVATARFYDSFLLTADAKILIMSKHSTS